jgi:hypothetical protein
LFNKRKTLVEVFFKIKDIGWRGVAPPPPVRKERKLWIKILI